MKSQDALLFLDLDRQGDQDQGTLFDEPRRRLSRDPSLRAGWAQYQALRALAWECAPEPGERMLRQALQQTRRERVQGQLAKTTGSDDLAREILLGRDKPRAGVPAWIWLLLLCASLGFGAMAWHQGLIGPDASANPAPSAKGDDAVSFEFPAQTAPAEAALSSPSGLSGAASSTALAGDSEDVKHEDSASRQARQLLREELHQAELRANPPKQLRASAVVPAPQRAAAKVAVQEPRAATAQRPPARPTATPDLLVKPAAQAYGQTTALQAALLAPPPDAAAQDAQPVARPTARPTATPLPVPTKPAPAAPVLAQAAAPAATAAAPTVSFAAPAAAAAGTAQDQAGMVLDSNDIVVGGRLRATLTLPDAKAVDLRLFDVGGKPVRTIADGQAGPGTVIYNVDAKDDNGQALGAGTYYLRVMTAWFSRVEPIQIH